MKSVVNSTTTYFVGKLYQKRIEGGNTIEEKTYFNGAQAVAMRKNGTLYWLVGDHLGSTNLTASADGTLYSEIRYSAYGEVRFDNGTTPTKFQYTGQLSQMDEIGLYYYVARFYDPVIAHFTQADIIIPQPNSTLAWDRFSYVSYNPIKYFDPSGHRICEDVDCKKTTPSPPSEASQDNSIGLSSEATAILVVIIAMESSSGATPDDVNYMKAWALLNLRTYNLTCGRPCNAPRTPLLDWRNHESKLLDAKKITGSVEEQTIALLEKYKLYKSGSAGFTKVRFSEIEAATKAAIADWFLYGTNSDKDPVHGATGFTDAEGLRYPDGGADDPYLIDLPNKLSIVTDTAAMEHLRTIYSHTGVVSQLYSYTADPYSKKEVYTFTWFKY